MLGPSLVFSLVLTLTAANSNLMELIAEQNVTVFLDLVEIAEMSEFLATSGPLTLVLPTDKAFKAMPPSYVENLKADPVALKDYVRYHIMKGDIFSWDIPGQTSIKSLNGRKLRLEFQHHFLEKPVLRINGAKVLRHDLQATNGVIQVIDHVLRMPIGSIEEVISKHPNLTQISKIVSISHFKNYLHTNQGRRLTFFAPTDEAFSKMSQNTLKRILSSSIKARSTVGYLLHSGSLTYETLKRVRYDYVSTHLFFEDILVTQGKDGEPLLDRVSKIVTPNIECDNGIIHIIDRVLMPDSPFNWG